MNSAIASTTTSPSLPRSRAIRKAARTADVTQPDASLARYPTLRSLRHCHAGPDWLRGKIALRFGDLDAAEQHFRTGLEWASSPDVRFIVDQGRCLQGLADVAAALGDIETARTHLDAAGALFAQHGARLYRDQVRAKQAELGKAR